MKRTLLLLFLAVFSACSSGGGSVTPAASTPSKSSESSTTTLTLTIPTPPPGASISSAARVRPEYVSYRTQSVTIAGTGVNEPGNTLTANVTAGSPGCSGTPTTCAIQIATNVGPTESFTVTAFSATGGTGSVLSSRTVTKAVTDGTSNSLAITLDPIVQFGPIAPPSNPAAVEHVIEGRNGAIYLFADKLYVFSPTTQSYTTCEASVQFNTPIVTGPDGNIWVADQSGNIDKIAISGATCGSITAYSIATASNVTALAVGSDGKIWFATAAAEIGTLTTTGTVTNVATADNAPNQMLLGGDGNVWFVTTTGEIEKVTTTGVVSVVSTGLNPISIALGSDGNVWYSATFAIGKITPGGTTTTYTQTNPVIGQGLVLGPDSQLWFINNLGMAEITTTGVTTTYTGWGAFSYSGSLAFGGDRNLYFGASAYLDEFIR